MSVVTVVMLVVIIIIVVVVVVVVELPSRFQIPGSFLFLYHHR